jgi:hypothetical protein
MGTSSLHPNPKKTLNRHDAKVAKEMMFPSLHRKTQDQGHGAFGVSLPLRKWTVSPGVLVPPLAGLAVW